MKREDQLKFCKSCIHKKSDMKRGIVCDLTNEYADFHLECKDYSVDPQSILRDVYKKEAKKEVGKQNKKILYSVLFIVGIFLIETVLLKFFNTNMKSNAVIARFFGLGISSFMILTAYHKLPYFFIRFRKAVNVFGEKTTRILIITIFLILILVLFIVRNFIAN